MKTGPPIRAVLFDLDGTLYHQGPLRVLMALELSSLPFSTGSIHETLRIWKILKCFRATREALRTLERPADSLAHLQYSLVAERLQVTFKEVEKVVNEWMYRRPLKYLRCCQRRSMLSFFKYAAEKGLPTGILSDYPAREKLKAMGFDVPLSLELCSSDPSINTFKPHPKGFLHACAVWNLDPGEVLYVGDRPEVDARGARAAGMPCVIFARRVFGGFFSAPDIGYITVPNFKGLRHVVCSNS